jgi:hypothetical protein
MASLWAEIQLRACPVSELRFNSRHGQSLSWDSTHSMASLWDEIQLREWPVSELKFNSKHGQSLSWVSTHSMASLWAEDELTAWPVSELRFNSQHGQSLRWGRTAINTVNLLTCRAKRVTEQLGNTAQSILNNNNCDAHFTLSRCLADEICFLLKLRVFLSEDASS